LLAASTPPPPTKLDLRSELELQSDAQEDCVGREGGLLGGYESWIATELISKLSRALQEQPTDESSSTSLSAACLQRES
jgi:hypothetical protein